MTRCKALQRVTSMTRTYKNLEEVRERDVADAKRQRMRLIKAHLERHTTAELLEIAKREHADVRYAFGPGQRARFIDAIARRRVGLRRWE